MKKILLLLLPLGLPSHQTFGANNKTLELIWTVAETGVELPERRADNRALENIWSLAITKIESREKELMKPIEYQQQKSGEDNEMEKLADKYEQTRKAFVAKVEQLSDARQWELAAKLATVIHQSRPGLDSKKRQATQRAESLEAEGKELLKRLKEISEKQFSLALKQFVGNTTPLNKQEQEEKREQKRHELEERTKAIKRKTAKRQEVAKHKREEREKKRQQMEAQNERTIDSTGLLEKIDESNKRHIQALEKLIAVTVEIEQRQMEISFANINFKFLGIKQDPKKIKTAERELERLKKELETVRHEINETDILNVLNQELGTNQNEG